MTIPINRVFRSAAIFCFVFVLRGSPALATQIWDADFGTTTFTKSGGDPNLPANQDAITANVALTRASTRGLYNAVSETAYVDDISPADTEWAFSGKNSNPSFSFGEGAASHAGLVFADWKTSHGSSPPSTNGVAGVVHLITDDIYLDIMFSEWSLRGGGSFSYERAIGVPEPSSLLILSAGLAILGYQRESMNSHLLR